tara:strand:- start:254 stop:1672 length:1419 start_codon:yes stop_codon:yes gene_type:complete
MLFNSVEFFIFLVIVFTLYWLIPRNHIKYKNLLILISSYFFYAWWDYRFLVLIILSTIVDYLCAKTIYNSKTNLKRKIFLIISILFNLTLLGFFKYFNFFLESFYDLLNQLGFTLNKWSLNIILPVGISFYTFQTLSYSIDIYRNKFKPVNNFIAFSSFISFFPQLVAGPIERASNLLPQFLTKKEINNKILIQGTRLIIFGLFKKVFIADSLAPYVDNIFLNFDSLGFITLWLGAIYFAIQIYCDFSGYSDIAIGTAKLFGFELKSNFRFPYFSRNIAEFWRRWHISLSSWFRDYLYIPLGGSRFGKLISLRNIFIIFIVSGFWHGSNWTFIFWGLVHAILYIPTFIFNTNRKYLNDLNSNLFYFPNFNELINIFTNFVFVTIAWVFFRSNSIESSFSYIIKMFNPENDFSISFKFGLIYVFIILLIDWFLRNDERLEFKYKKAEWVFFSILILLIIEKFQDYKTFIYFQF